MSESMKGKHTGESSPTWKGDNIKSKLHIHKRVKKCFPKPKQCQNPDCRKETSKLDLVCVTGIYHVELSNWQYLCRSCHMKLDYSNGTLHPRRRHQKQKENIKLALDNYIHSYVRLILVDRRRDI